MYFPKRASNFNKSIPSEWKDWNLKTGVKLTFFLLHHSDIQITGQFTFAKDSFPWTWGNCHSSVTILSGVLSLPGTTTHVLDPGMQRRDECTVITGSHHAVLLPWTHPSMLNPTSVSLPLPSGVCSVPLFWVSTPKSVPSRPTPCLFPPDFVKLPCWFQLKPLVRIIHWNDFLGVTGLPASWEPTSLFFPIWGPLHPWITSAVSDKSGKNKQKPDLPTLLGSLHFILK